MTGQIAVGTLDAVDVLPRVLPQQPEGGEPLVAEVAVQLGVAGGSQLPVEVVLELGVVGEGLSTGGTGHQLLLEVGAKVVQHFIAVATSEIALYVKAKVLLVIANFM